MSRAGVVVVGGGIQGAAAALHLLEAGAGSVRLIERDGMFEGTSAAGAGFVGIWAAAVPALGAEEEAVERYGLGFYRDLQERGHDIDFVQNGMLYVAARDDVRVYLEPMDGNEADPDTVMVDGERVEQLTGGVVRAAEVHGAIYQPAGAQIFAPAVGAALTARIRELGGVVDTRRPATGLRVAGGRVTGVETATGVIDCDTAVLAAGAWTNELLRPLGVYLPCIPLLTSRMITEPLDLPAGMPTILLLGIDETNEVLWLRRHRGALLWGGSYAVSPHAALLGAERLPARFDETALDGVLHIQEMGRKAERLMPVLARYKSYWLKHGAPCYTPDQRSLVGPVPGVEGLYAIAGDNEQGITHGPGFGKALADHVVHGSSELTSLDAWRIDRFDGRFTGDAEVAEALHVATP